MNRAQKIAWFNLIVLCLGIILAAIAVGILSALAGMPCALHGLGFGGLVLLLHCWGLSFSARSEAKAQLVLTSAMIWFIEEPFSPALPRCVSSLLPSV